MVNSVWNLEVVENLNQSSPVVMKEEKDYPMLYVLARM